MLHWLDVHPDADAAALSDEMAERLLRMFGITKRDASVAHTKCGS